MINQNIDDKVVLKSIVKEVSEEKVVQNDADIKANPSSTWYFYFIITIGLLPCIVGGARIVWTSPTLIKLTSTDPNINPLGRPITTQEVSLLVGLPGLAALPASLIFAKLADSIGRKRCMQVMGFAMLLCFIGLSFSNSLPVMIAILICTMYSVSGITCVFPIYFTEVCEDHNRAKFGSLISICLILGQLYSNFVGPLFSIRYYTLLIAAPLIPFLILFFFAPETPMYLCAQGKTDECLKALKKLRGNKSESELMEDFTKIYHSLATTPTKDKISVIDSVKKLFLTKEGRFGFLLGFLVMLLQTISGGPVLVPLMAPIFQQYSLSVSGETVAVYVSVVKLFSLFLTFLIIERIGRRPLLILSCAGSCICMLVLGVLFYLLFLNTHLLDYVQWLPFATILIYYVVYGVGLCAISTPMISILFPLDLRSISSSLVFTVEHVSIALCQLIYPLLAEAAGTHWCMWIFAIDCFIGAVLVYWLMPETKGKSIDEIQDTFKNHRYFKSLK